MSYNKDFYKKYEKYLKEDIVRKAHNAAFNFFEYAFDFKTKAIELNVIDFGCGLCEFLYYGVYNNYVGIDQNLARDEMVILGDYLKMSKEELLQEVNKRDMGNITAFISLFSTECCMPIKDKYNFYKKIFKEHESIKVALVSGFYYKGKEKEEVVTEVGDLKSYQTIEAQQDFINSEFEEIRIYKEVPSNLFGDNVIEVWKILIKND